jgi:hypothetical protein
MDDLVQRLDELGSYKHDDHSVAHEAKQEITTLRAELAEWEKLRDPSILHANLLRGLPAQLGRDTFLHLAGDAAMEHKE